MRALSQISLADVADAVRWLSPDQEAFEIIAGVLGFKIEGDDDLDKTIKPLRSSRDTCDRAKSKTEIANLPQNDEVPPKPSRKDSDANYEGDDGAIVVKTLSPGLSMTVPPYIQQSDPLESAAFSLSPATHPRPLLPHHQARSFVWELLAQDLPSTEIDCDAITDQLSRGLIPELRFLNRKSIRKRVHLLVDESPVMLPYRNDVVDLQRSVKNIIGPSLSGDFSFAELPDRGVAKSTGEQLLTYPFPGAETTVLLVSDLGVTRSFGYQNVSSNEWACFLKRLVGTGCRVIVVSPYGQDRLRKLHYKGVSIVDWGTKHHSNTKVSVQDFARLLSPAALLDLEFIREARIKFFPGSSPGLEADLLFSWLVAVFNSRVVSFRQETVRELREELMSKPTELEKSLEFLKTYRGKDDSQFQLPERIAFEEQLVTDALTENITSVEQAFARMIRSLVDDDMNPRLARWAIAVADELPGSVTDAPLYPELRVAAQLRLGIISEDFHTPDSDNASDGNRSWLLPKGVKLGIRREKGKLIMSDSLRGAEISLDVPGTVPRYFIVEKKTERVSVQIWPGQPDVILPFGLPMEISSPLSGVRYRLKITKPFRMRVRILIAAPGDVDKERRIAEELIVEWNIRNGDESNIFLEAVLWEKHAAPENWEDGEGPQEPITRQLVDDCDCAIGIFWNRIGTPTTIAAGGAVEEVERMLTVLKRPVMLYFSDMPIAPSKIDVQQKAKLEAFKETMKADGLIWEYNSPEAFQILLSRHLDKQIRQWFSPTLKLPIPEDEELRRYQATLKDELGYIRMLGMPGVESIKVNLNNDTFVPLRLSDQQVRGGKSQPQDSFQEHEGESQIFYPDEVMKLAFKKRRMLLVIGDPGVGKTTLLKYYALCALEESNRLGFAVPPNVFYLPLRDLGRDKATNHYDSLPANLAIWAGKHHQTIGARLFDDWLQSTPSLVLLDGLDEISNTEERKEVCRWINGTWSGFGQAFFVVTSRATGYLKEERIELEVDHERADVQDFTPAQQERFLRNWFTAAFLKDPCEKGADEAEWERQQRAEAGVRTTTMVAHLNGEKNKGLRQLAAIPMILQIMAILWKERDFMPENRVKLYEASLDYLLEFRDKRRGIKPLISAVHARQVLAPVSLWMLETLKKDEVPKAEMYIAMQEWLDTLNTSEPPPTAALFCDYLVKRAGLLVETGGKEYLFRHKSFREYLAGVQLKNDRPYERLNMLVSNFGEDLWTEPLRFFIASVDAQVFDKFMEKLFNSPVSEAMTTKQQLLLQTIIEEAKGQKVDALCRKLLEPDTTVSRQRVILDCLKTIAKPSALAVLEQFRVQELEKGSTENTDVLDRAEEVILAFGGKVRERVTEKNISGKPLSLCNPNEQNAEYILIPGGNYWYSSMQKAVDVADCYVAKYPVTNKLYRSFIGWLEEKDTGQIHASALRVELERIAESKEWGPAFGDYIKGGNDNLAALFSSTYDEDRKFGGENQPVVGVSWYAARAYCLWLSSFEESAGYYRLANEIEWEWAAGGKQGTTGQKVREYPWAEEKGKAHPKLLNFSGSIIGATTPVGSYPDGATPEGLYDMAGNVLEWCCDWYSDAGTFTNPLGAETGSTRALRGGGWYLNDLLCRSANRLNFTPETQHPSIGFRLVFIP
ncbi:MAG: SUMF1/EgtB/PvdO family nonheme iron enzyme [Chlorobium sp.]